MPLAEAKSWARWPSSSEKYGEIVRVVSVEDFSTEAVRRHPHRQHRPPRTVQDRVRKLGCGRRAGLRPSPAPACSICSTIPCAPSMRRRSPSSSIIRPSWCSAAPCSSASSGKDREIEQLGAKLASIQIDGLFSEAKLQKGVRIITAAFSSTTSDTLRAMCDKIRDFAPQLRGGARRHQRQARPFAAVVGPNAQEKGAHAGNIVKQVAQITGGKGGGRADSAMAGAKDLTKIDEALCGG